MAKTHPTPFSAYSVQRTLGDTLEFSGVGIHSGEIGQMRLTPAPANHGIRFWRRDLAGSLGVPAHFDAVVSTANATTLGCPDNPTHTFRTVEHIMAALYAAGISNLDIELWGPEIPILDGSAGPFSDRIAQAGTTLQPFTRPTLKILRPIKVFERGAVCELLPRSSLRLTVSVDFNHPQIGLQTYALELSPQSFHQEIASARTFGFLKDFDRLKAAKLALGASLNNVLAFSEDGVLNPEGERFTDECARHKLLDALGDLALCGSWFEGELVSFRGGHSIHFSTLKALRDNPTYWTLVPAEPLKSGTLEKSAPLDRTSRL